MSLHANLTDVSRFRMVLGRARELQPLHQNYLAPLSQEILFIFGGNLSKCVVYSVFAVILASLLEAPAPLSEDFWPLAYKNPTAQIFKVEGSMEIFLVPLSFP